MDRIYWLVPLFTLTVFLMLILRPIWPVITYRDIQEQLWSWNNNRIICYKLKYPLYGHYHGSVSEYFFIGTYLLDIDFSKR